MRGDLHKWQGIEQEFRVGKPLQRMDIQMSILCSMNMFDALKKYKFFGNMPAMIYSKDYDGFLRNGSRIYLCNFSLEIATPECRNAFELLKYDKAMEFYAQIAADMLNKGELRDESDETTHDTANAANGISHGSEPEPESELESELESEPGSEPESGKIQCWRANTEIHPAFTRGTHENYSLAVRDFRKECFIPFLIIKPLFFGAGGYVSSSLSVKEMIESAEYVVSPRAMATKHIYGGAGVRKHPLFSIKGISNMRIHIDSGEGLRVEMARFLNNAITSFVIQAIEEEIIRHVDAIDAPIETLKNLSRNTDGDWRLRLKSGEVIHAMDVMNTYIDAIERLFEEKNADRWDLYALKTFKRLHSKMSMGLLENDFVVKSVEWLLKLNLIERGKCMEMERLRECLSECLHEWSDLRAEPSDERCRWMREGLYGLEDWGLERCAEWWGVRVRRDEELEKMLKISACFAFSNVCDADFYEVVADEIGIERLISDEDIAEAMLNPPPNSRSLLRNTLLEEILGMGEPENNILVRWNRIVCPPTREKEAIFDELDGWDERKIAEKVREVRERFAGA